jgi:hypothetical protein
MLLEISMPLLFKDGNGAVSGRISAGFESGGFGFRGSFSPTVFGFRYLKHCGFGADFHLYPRITIGAPKQSSTTAAH